ncbi:DUF4240 domain-containing protein [Microbispora sp. KK1-11]|uniref:DUF4240 domain-containing protein n=1 Tax=Microbispora sp. KK1-11 TaxID=2053005 RepID=UPI00163BA522|nr:DUF4240 domain-containing protein [Microbispora sp. KK1-11]
MTDEVFWELVGMLDGVVDEDGADLLGERLSSLGAEEVEAFCAHLAAKARALTALALEVRPVPDVSDDGGPPIPLVGDAYENLLYAMVAAGRERYEAVLADPAAAEDEEWDAGEAELLVDAVATVLWDVAGLDWYEEFDSLLSGLPVDGRWYDTRRGSAWKSAPRQYENAAHALDRALNDSAEWRAWWSQTGLRKSKVGVTVNEGRDLWQVERGRTIARAEFRMGRSYFADRDPAALTKLAVEETAHIMDAIARALDMTPPPPLPPSSR